MALDALLFDIDGTLFDTNALHVEAWRRTFEAKGYRVGGDRIQTEIGKGGDKLVPAILGEDAEQRDGEALRKLHPAEFEELARERGVKPFPGALELLAAVRERKLKVVVATSSKRKNLRVLEEVAGTKLASLCDLIVTADDARQTKPAPDLVVAAVDKLGMSPAQCALIGDTLYDMEAAKHAGVIGLGVETGFQSGQTLLRSGARTVYADVAAVLARLDEALQVLSPTVISLTSKVLEGLMHEALGEAERGLHSGEVPIGSVIADGGGQIVARGFNQLLRTADRTAHAEMVAFRAASGWIPQTRKDYVLVSTLEPCVMCTGAAMMAGIDTIVYGMRAPTNSGTARVLPLESLDSQMPRIVGGVLAKKSRKLLERFVKDAREPLLRAFVEQLLAAADS
ncbi:MAG TPA: HAD-IA family hydrolase [Pseudomonadota bacterium]|nr:HAD-IA family hydrolase [Pseudomonadota bacterium]